LKRASPILLTGAPSPAIGAAVGGEDPSQAAGTAPPQRLLEEIGRLEIIGVGMPS
jgi:hypothetical protein